MKKDKDIWSNLKSSDLGFKVPKDYFENLDLDTSLINDISKSGFTTPDAYFENLNNSIFSKIENKHIPIDTGFKTPVNYFKNFESNPTNKTSKNSVISLFYDKYKNIIPVAIAASLILFIGISYYFFNNQNNINLDDISSVEIENWLNENSVNLNSNDIAEVYSDIEIYDNSLYPADEISDYLEDKDIEILFLEN